MSHTQVDNPQPEVNGGNFCDVEGDVNEYRRDDYSVHMSGRDNVMTHVTRPAMINAAEGSRVTVYVQNYSSLPGNAYPLPVAPSPSDSGYSVCPQCAHRQQCAPQQPNNRSYVSNVNPSPTRSFNAPSPTSPPATMPVPPPPFNTPSSSPTTRFARKSSSVQMPVPTLATPPAGMRMPSTPHNNIWNAIPTTPNIPSYVPSQERASDEAELRPAFHLSIPSTPLEPRYSLSSNRSQGPALYASTTPPPPTVGMSYTPLPTSPEQVPAHSVSTHQPYSPLYNNPPVFFNQRARRSQTAPIQWTSDPACPPETGLRAVPENELSSDVDLPPFGLSQRTEESQDDPFVSEAKPPKNKLRRMSAIIRGKQRS